MVHYILYVPPLLGNSCSLIIFVQFYSEIYQILRWLQGCYRVGAFIRSRILLLYSQFQTYANHVIIRCCGDIPPVRTVLTIDCHCLLNVFRANMYVLTMMCQFCQVSIVEWALLQQTESCLTNLKVTTRIGQLLKWFQRFFSSCYQQDLEMSKLTIEIVVMTSKMQYVHELKKIIHEKDSENSGR